MFPGLKKIQKIKDIVLSKYFIPGLFVSIFAMTLLFQTVVSLPIALLFLIGDTFSWQHYGVVISVFALNSLVLSLIITGLLVPLRKKVMSWVEKFTGWM